MIVIDASLAFEISIATKDAMALGDKLMGSPQLLAAPEVIELEFMQTLRRFHRQGEIDLNRAKKAMRNFADLGIELFSHRPLRPRIWDLRENLTAHDAAYVALAEILDAPLWTRDAKFRGATGARATIEIL